MSSKKVSSRGEEGFIQYYEKLFEKEAGLFFEALRQKNKPILRFNPQNEKILKKLWQKEGLTWETLKWYPYALKWPSERPEKTPLPGHEPPLFYAQNPSSLIPVLALDPQPGETILDACAAPGGKALFIAERLKGQGEFYANDSSSARRERMRKIFQEHGLDSFIHILGKNALSLFKTHRDYFDKILLDAPCSSEKHVFNNPKELKHWSPGRIRGLKNQQFMLLKRLFYCLKPGGRLVYSTCAVTPEENEEVIEKFLKKFADQAVKKPTSSEIPVQDGRILPHKNPGMDPLFVAIIEKRIIQPLQSIPPVIQ